MYDFAHPIGDALEGITHSLCSLEYEDHRPLYDWVVEHAQNKLPGKPRQIEFSRLNLTRTIMSKRYLRMLVEGGYVSGWDDPRMPTLCALRRRGYTPAAIRDFIDRIGVAKADSVVDIALLEHCVREDLGQTVPRAMLPFSVQYGQIVLYHSLYIVCVTIGFLIVGLYLSVMRRWSQPEKKRTRVITLLLLLLTCFLAGLNGIRQLMRCKTAASGSRGRL